MLLITTLTTTPSLVNTSLKCDEKKNAQLNFPKFPMMFGLGSARVTYAISFSKLKVIFSWI